MGRISNKSQYNKIEERTIYECMTEVYMIVKDIYVHYTV